MQPYFLSSLFFWSVAPPAASVLLVPTGELELPGLAPPFVVAPEPEPLVTGDPLLPVVAGPAPLLPPSVLSACMVFASNRPFACMPRAF
jgi:hypothetical protein